MESWGRYPRAKQTVETMRWRDQTPRFGELKVLPRGQGRSYGDSCLNDGGVLISTAGLDRFISLDEDPGGLRCEAGLTLEAILDLAVPRGRFLPVVPGTQYVSAGGPIANGIHGKNHHRAGTFGRHVRRLELLRSDGSRRVLGPGDPLFHATVGGLGLTGIITWAEIQLVNVPGSCILNEAIPFDCLDDFLRLSAESDAAWEYTVAWIDCLSRQVGRGVFLRGAHASGLKRAPSRRVEVPLVFPSFVLTRYPVREFNRLYRLAARPGRGLTHYDPFFFPLDGVQGWNRIYGKPGFFQFQCVVPTLETIAVLLAEVARAGSGSFLSVLKTFGDLPSPGMLSFPRKGFTLALDFANRRRTTLQLLEALEEQVRGEGGALYPAKDAPMAREPFVRSSPRLAEFLPFIDPAFSSSFWRRVSA